MYVTGQTYISASSIISYEMAQVVQTLISVDMDHLSEKPIPLDI